jgi:hypothetical protein
MKYFDAVASYFRFNHRNTLTLSCGTDVVPKSTFHGFAVLSLPSNQPVSSSLLQSSTIYREGIDTNELMPSNKIANAELVKWPVIIGPHPIMQSGISS